MRMAARLALSVLLLYNFICSGIDYNYSCRKCSRLFILEHRLDRTAIERMSFCILEIPSNRSIWLFKNRRLYTVEPDWKRIYKRKK